MPIMCKVCRKCNRDASASYYYRSFKWINCTNYKGNYTQDVNDAYPIYFLFHLFDFKIIQYNTI